MPTSILDVYTIRDWRGGIADEVARGVRGSFKFGYGLDIHGEENTLKCNQKLKKDSGTTVTDLILAWVPATDGNLYGFGDTGKIYKRTPAGVWSEVYTDADGKILGAAEYEHKDGSGTYRANLIWATQTKLKRIYIAGDWATDVVTIGTFAEGVAGDWHTMRMAVGVLMICDGHYIAMLDYEGAFNNKALDIIPGNVTSCLLDMNNQVIIGSIERAKSKQGWLWTWDKIEPSWITKKAVGEKGVNSMSFIEMGILIQAGINGVLKYWDLVNLVPIKTISGGGYVNPGGTTEFKGLPHFGINGSEKCGIYSYGRTDKNDVYSLNLEYIPSHGKLSGIEIGALTVYDANLFVSWKDGTTYGVDTIDSANKANGIYEGLEFNAGKPFEDKLFKFIKITTKPLPAECSVVVKYKMNKTADWILTKMGDGAESLIGAGKTKGIWQIEGQGEIYEIRVELNSSGNDCPEITSINTYFEGLNIW